MTEIGCGSLFVLLNPDSHLLTRIINKKRGGEWNQFIRKWLMLLCCCVLLLKWGSVQSTIHDLDDKQRIGLCDIRMNQGSLTFMISTLFFRWHHDLMVTRSLFNDSIFKMDKFYKKKRLLKNLFWHCSWGTNTLFPLLVNPATHGHEHSRNSLGFNPVS